MNSVTLTFFELVRLLKVFTYATLALAAVFTAGRYAFLETSLVKAVIQSVSASILFVTFGLGAISKKAWTSPRLAKWLGRPMVHGLWWGTLYTDYRAEFDQPLAPIPIAFVIRQSYFFLSIQSFTKNQPAKSSIESLLRDEKTSDVHLSYVFEMRRLAYAENKITMGYGELILQDSEQRLVGDYWTNSPTQGRLELTLVQRDCLAVNSFAVAERKWMESQANREVFVQPS
jgi:hypothetical protein